MYIYEICPRNDKRGVDLISDAAPFGRLWYGKPDAVNNAIGYAKFRSRSHDAVIRVYDEAGNEFRAMSRVRARRINGPTMRCYSVGCGIASQMQSATPLDMRSFTAVHMML
jgi:hypothetical protein